MSVDPEAIEVARIRDGAHPGNPIDDAGDDGAKCQLLGATGEVLFARTCGLPVDKRALPGGDGGVDFVAEFLTTHGRGTRVVTIDVKSAQAALFLFIKEPDIVRCADILVLCALDGPKATEKNPNPLRTPRLVGWEHKAVMQLMPVADFGHGQRNYYRAASELRPMSQLSAILALRHKPWAGK